MTQESIAQVLNKLIGIIDPYGETNHDEECLKNINKLGHVLVEFTSSIIDVHNRNEKCYEHSRIEVARQAKKIIEEIHFQTEQCINPENESK